jgi:hypothetical protein
MNVGAEMVEVPHAELDDLRERVRMLEGRERRMLSAIFDIVFDRAVIEGRVSKSDEDSLRELWYDDPAAAREVLRYPWGPTA